eukprot:955348_1
MSEPISGKNQTLAFDTIEKLNIGEMINSSPTNWTYITGTLNQPLTGLRSVPYGHNILVIGGFTFDIKAVSACDWVYWEHNLSHSHPSPFGGSLSSMSECILLIECILLNLQDLFDALFTLLPRMSEL